MHVQITYKGEAYDIAPFRPADFVVLERRFGIGQKTFEDDPRLEWLLFMAHRKLVKAGAITTPFDDNFVEDVDSFALVDDEAPAPDPTTTEPSS